MLALANDRFAIEGGDAPLNSVPSRLSLPVVTVSALVAAVWIVGGGGLLHALAAYFDNKTFTDLVDRHTTHVGWEGCVAWDLIFPLFVFMTGVTMPLTLTRRLERGEKKRVLYGRIFRRMVLLV